MKISLVGIINQYYRLVYYPKIHRLMKGYHVSSVLNTIRSLINSKKSLSRFGDGEIKWILMKSNIPFEKNSKCLSNKLLHTLESTNDNLEIALPCIFYSDKDYTWSAKRFYKLNMIKYGYKLFNWLDKDEQYFNTDISRIYTGHSYNRHISKYLFKELKKVWKNKKILIIEGRGTRLGVKNNLFNNTISISRIECPINNAFESYNKILKSSLDFLSNNNNYLTLIALGPTATVLASDLCNNNFRAIDIGHIDIEYEWYLMNAKKKVNIPNRYVNEVNNKLGPKFCNISDKKYSRQIVKNIY